MNAGSWFWILYVIVILAVCGFYWPFGPEYRRHAGVSLVILALIGLLGYGLFGGPLK